MTPEQRLQELGLMLPAVTPPRGNFDAFRSAVGVGSLPRGFAVEIEAIVAFED
jgi:enamine deaminase RidA (YjgF/YER057c/UK114 family)